MNTETTAAETTTILEDMVRDITEALGTDTLTPYQVSKVVNGALEASGSEIRVPSQMMYNYTRNGMISKGKKGSGKEIRYTVEETVAFTTKYVGKRI